MSGARARLAILAAVGTLVVFTAVSRAEPHPRGLSWKEIGVVTNVGSRTTGAVVTGEDRRTPVAGRMRLIAPRGAVTIGISVECERNRRIGSYSWAIDGARWKLVSGGRPIVRSLPSARRVGDPTWCKWVVSAFGARGRMTLALEIRG